MLGPSGWDTPTAYTIVHRSVPLDHATLLLHLKHFPVDLRILACQLAFLQSNGRHKGRLQSLCACPPTAAESHLPLPPNPLRHRMLPR